MPTPPPTDAPRRSARAWSARAAAAVAALAVGGAVALAAPTTASAAAYRYWTYWWGGAGESSWAFATAGAGAHVPADGAVEGWRFQTTASSAGGSPPADGRSPASVFAELCSTVAPVAGSKRVAVLIDSGTAADAPPGQTPPEPRLNGRCVTAAPAATGAALMAAAGAALRFDAGLLCAIDGYPGGECAPVVASAPSTTATSASPALSPGGAAASPPDAAPSPTPIATAAAGSTDGSSGTPWAALGGLLLVVAVGGAAVVRLRRAP
jgi:hypothetical protein